MDTSSEKKNLEKNNPARDALRGVPKRFVSDIVSRPRVAPRTPAIDKQGVTPAPKPKEEKKKETVPPVTPPPPVHVPAAATPFFAHRPEHPATRPEEPRREALHHPRSPRRGLLAGGIAVVLIGIGAFVALSVLPRATVTLNLKETSINFTDQVRVDSGASGVSVEAGRIVLPGELLTARKNVELSFPASGVKQVQAKATGKITLFNAFSSTPQKLIASTRVESPDGKIFRLNQAVTVDGAKVQNGEKIPSQGIVVTVTADEAGEAWNVPAAKGWHILAFKGTSKYDGFYGESVAPMTGGFVGEQAVPSEADLASARSKVRETLLDALKAQLLVALSDRLKVLDSTEQSKITKEDIRTDGADPKTFSIFAEAELRELAFMESMLRDAIFERAARAIQYPTTALDFKLAYDVPKVEAGAAVLTVAVNGSFTLAPAFDPEQLRESILGNDEQTLKATVLALPGLESVQTLLWPFWVHSVPNNPAKVDISVNGSAK
ncbi:MAG: hypothetical protein V1656_02300 [Candidatus Jorgensenbacteria bacterium]